MPQQNGVAEQRHLLDGDILGRGNGCRQLYETNNEIHNYCMKDIVI